MKLVKCKKENKSSTSFQNILEKCYISYHLSKFFLIIPGSLILY